MSELKNKMLKAINEIDFDNMYVTQKDTLEKALIMLQVKWRNYRAVNLISQDITTNLIFIPEGNKTPSWDWWHYCYSIVPEKQKKYVPFDKSDAEYLIRKKVTSKHVNVHNNELEIKFIGIDGVQLVNNSFHSYEELLSDFTFLDGKPCGKEV